jgi:hypothetical protein
MSEKVINSLLPSGSDDQLVDVIKEDAVISIKMSTGYYKRIQNVIGFLIEGKPTKEVQKAHQSIASRNVTEPWIYNYETLLILCKEFEKGAQEGNFIEKMTISELREAMEKAEKIMVDEELEAKEEFEKKQQEKKEDQ